MCTTTIHCTMSISEQIFDPFSSNAETGYYNNTVPVTGSVRDSCVVRVWRTRGKNAKLKKKFKHSRTSHCVRTHRVVIQARPPPRFHAFDFRFKRRRTKWLSCRWPCVQPDRILFSLYFWQPCDSPTCQRIMLINSKLNYRGRNGRDQEYVLFSTFC